jgi:hypothetical protein
MDARLPTHNDLAAFEDKLGREELVWQVAREIATGKPPSFASRICCGTQPTRSGRIL